MDAREWDSAFIILCGWILFSTATGYIVVSFLQGNWGTLIIAFVIGIFAIRLVSSGRNYGREKTNIWMGMTLQTFVFNILLSITVGVIATLLMWRYYPLYDYPPPSPLPTRLWEIELCLPFFFLVTSIAFTSLWLFVRFRNKKGNSSQALEKLN